VDIPDSCASSVIRKPQRSNLHHMTVKGHQRRAVSSVAVVVVVAVLLAAAAGYMMFQPSTSARYIAHLEVTKSSSEWTDYNFVNIAKDGVFVGLAYGALSTCTAGTLGACAAAAPIVGALIGGMVNDEVAEVRANFTFTNSGNGTASGITYTSEVFMDGSLIASDPHSLADVGPYSAVTVTLSHTVKLSDVPTSLWNLLQGKGKITMQIINLSYAGGA